MQAPGGPSEDRDGSFQHGGWLVPYFDEKIGEIMTEWANRAGAFLFGRKTYEIFAGSWPRSTDPADEIAKALNTRPKFVASRTLHKVDWSNSSLLKGDVAEEVAKLKAQEGGEIQVHGSGDLLQTLLKRDLIDTLRLWQFPVVLGTGKRLFGEGAIPGSFRLVDTQVATTGVVLPRLRAGRRPQIRRTRGRPGDCDLRFGRSTPVTESAIADRLATKPNTKVWGETAALVRAILALLVARGISVSGTQPERYSYPFRTRLSRGLAKTISTARHGKRWTCSVGIWMRPPVRAIATRVAWTSAAKWTKLRLMVRAAFVTPDADARAPALAAARVYIVAPYPVGERTAAFDGGILGPC